MLSIKKYILIFLIISSSNLGILIALNLNSHNIQVNSTKIDVDNHIKTSNNDYEQVIVFFNTSSYDGYSKTRFEFYGGFIKIDNDWNNIFNNISGFSGIIPKENISSYKSEFPNINVERDEIIETQLNYASMQSQAVNSTWYLNGYKGNTDSSIAILDTGINASHDYFNGNIAGWQNFVNDDLISDDNGHGTFISSVIAGTGTEDYNSNNPSTIRLYGNYSHLDLFEEYLPAKNYSIKIFSANLTKTDSNIYINSIWDYDDIGINKFWFELYYNNTLVNFSFNEINNQLYGINHNISQNGPGIYDIYIKYYKTLNSIPEFSYIANLSFIPESYANNYNHFTGIANASKILAYKIANQSGYGYTSDLISALASVIQNRTSHHIVSVCLSIGTLGDNFMAINKVLDEVSNNGILVVIAAGNTGVKGADPLNKLATNKNAIVVGAINDKDQITSYSSMGKEVEDSILKPDIVAPGGSILPGYRDIISADSKTNEATAAYGTSISTAIVSAAVNILIEAKWGSWNEWENHDFSERVDIIKSTLLMTASETNQDREDDPESTINESGYSPSQFFGTINSLKDEHEGYGRINIESAIDATNKFMIVNNTISGNLTSSELNPLESHVFARRILLNEDTQYLFNLTEVDQSTNFDLFLFSNESTQYGEPILLESTRKWYFPFDFNSIYFTPKRNQTECIVIIKAISGTGGFTLNISTVKNLYSPQLEVPEIPYFDGTKNTTIMGFQEFLGANPLKNYSIDRFRFYIEYFDNDTTNVPPQEVYVSIIETSQNYTLTQPVNVTTLTIDNNYTNGAIFQSEYIQFSKPGTYHYFFIASDGAFQSRYPEIGELNVTIEFPTDSEPFPYNHSFNEGLGSWTYNGTGWSLLNQSNNNDNRSRVYLDDWKSIYFGRDHDYPLNYTYQPYPYPNGSLTSPLFNLTQINENYTQPFAKIGLRTSINSGDYIFLQININWTGWVNLRTYTNEERDWFMEEVNLTQFIGNFIQFRLIALLDEDFDPVNYKGLMIDYFALVNYTNSNIPQIYFTIDSELSATQISKFERIIFSCRYYDADNNYPEFVYLEMKGTNYTMINIYGDWNSSSNSSLKEGILFRRSVRIGDFLNQSFRFHVSDGKYINSTLWYNRNNLLFTITDPTPLHFSVMQSNKLIGYQFSSENLNEFYVLGTPEPKETTSWLKGDNTWHLVTRLYSNFIYGGMGQSFGRSYQGYGLNWDSKLVTKPIQLEGEYRSYLKFNYEISLQNEFNLEEHEVDRCIVSISTDFGENWIILKEYTYTSEPLSGNESIEITNYADSDIMIMFTLQSNDNVIGSGFGWLLSDIYVGYDKSTDFINPNIAILNPLEDHTINAIVTIEANISDNIEVNADKIYVYINNRGLDHSLINFDSDTGILLYDLNTNLYRDGKYELKVIAYDKEGNKSEESIEIAIKNGFLNWRNWGPWIIIIIGIAIMGAVIYVTLRRKAKKGEKAKIAEKVKLKYKDQDKERIELIEPEGEIIRPYTLHCRFCKSWFESNTFNYICPVCDHDQIYAAYNCINCGRWYYKDEPGEHYFCKKCEGVRLIRRDIEEVKGILGKEGKVLRKFEYRKKKFSILD